MPSVAICALTFHRPRGLGRLLDGLAALQFEDDAHRPDLRIVIVDNDPEGSARPVVEGRLDQIGAPVTYVIEPRRGIPLARNRAVAEAGAAEFAAFIDDDEVPEPRWLDELLRVQRVTGADVVTGPVVAEFEDTPPKWVLRGSFYDRRRFRTGESVGAATTSSVLIARPVLEAHRPPFNEAMRFTGGSDTHFFLRAKQDGFSIVWADDAVVYETIPLSRTTARWILARQYRRGVTFSYCLRELNDSPRRRAKRIGHAGVSVVRGVGMSVLALVRGRRALVAGLQRVCYGAGMVAGLFGVSYEEYRTHHGG